MQSGPSIANFLKNLLGERLEHNASYSLRALARAIGLSASHLSLILGGKRCLSPAAAQKVAQNLRLSAAETDYLILLAQRDGAKTPDLRQTIQKRLDDLASLRQAQVQDVDDFRLIKDWYHIPILEMTYLSGFEFSPRSVAQRLGITLVQAELAFERLTRLGLLECLPDGSYRKTERNLVFRSVRRSEAFAAFHYQMLTLAREAITGQPLTERFISSQTLCVARSQIDEAKALTRTFLQQMAQLFEQPGLKEETYQLNVQLFNLTDGQPKKSLSRQSGGKAPRSGAAKKTLVSRLGQS